MKECMNRCRWCPLIPITFGIISFLLGYFLDAEIVRILWLIFSGLAILMGLFCFIMMSVMSKNLKWKANKIGPVFCFLDDRTRDPEASDLGNVSHGKWYYQSLEGVIIPCFLSFPYKVLRVIPSFFAAWYLFPLTSFSTFRIRLFSVSLREEISAWARGIVSFRFWGRSLSVIVSCLARITACSTTFSGNFPWFNATATYPEDRRRRKGSYVTSSKRDWPSTK